MKNLFYNWGALAILIASVLIFSRAFLLHGLLPIPGDTIIGLYHPYRDLYAADYPNGIPYKNFLITDPVRQIYIWKNLSLEVLKMGQLPLWNPYEFAGTPLLANFQSSPFYPLNILLFAKPFEISWSIFVLLQPLLAGLFMYWYLRNFKIHPLAAVLGGITFAFSGFAVAWMEWGTILSTGLWLPLILLAIEKLLVMFESSKIKRQKSKLLVWSGIYLFAISSSLLAGHLQTFFYLIIFTIVYFFGRWWQMGRNVQLFVLFLILNSCFLILTAIQWIPALQFILLSARDTDQSMWQKEGWFIPYKHLLQFFAPDFFGNPATLNYWGVWNYAELVGYVGIIPLIFALFALLSRLGKRTGLFGLSLFVSLILSLPNSISKIPFELQIPFLSTAQPTRLLFITCLSLSVLAAFGFDFFIKKHFEENKKEILTKLVFSIVIIGAVLAGLWILIIFFKQWWSATDAINLSIAKKNLILPTILYVFFIFLTTSVFVIKKKEIKGIIFVVIVIVVSLDLLRFANKFDPFVSRAYIFPETKSIEFLQKQPGIFRVASLDSRLVAPNFLTQYHIQSISGYDPLYLTSYAQYVSAMERNTPNINPPYGFNRIIEPRKYNSQLFNLLNVKYVLSLDDIQSPQYTKVFEEGQTKIYQNKNVIPRVFLVSSIVGSNNRNQTYQKMFHSDLSKIAVVEGMNSQQMSSGSAKINSYSENKVVISANSSGSGFLVLTDIYYPTWSATVNGQSHEIQKVDGIFRGVAIPSGESMIIFQNTLH